MYSLPRLKAAPKNRSSQGRGIFIANPIPYVRGLYHFSPEGRLTADFQ